MGASEFHSTGFGATVADAFLDAREHALHEYGHGGYTGTIAEKRSYKLVNLQALGMTRAAFHKALEAAEEARFAHEDAKEVSWRGYTKAEATKVQNRAKRLAVKAEKLAKGNSYAIGRYAEVLDDKWGPALAIEVTGKAARDWRAAVGLAGRRGKVFDFFGTASS